MSIKSFIVKNIITPPKVYESLLLNRLGLQPLRILWQELIRRLTPRSVPPEYASLVAELETNGIVVIHNFLPKQDHENLKREFDSAISNQNVDLRFRKSGPHLIREVDVLSWTEKYKVARDLILKSFKLKRIVECVARRKVRLPQACILQTVVIDDGTQLGEMILHHSENFDTDGILHQDHSLSVFKAWYYVDNVEEVDGAFVFTPGSHRISKERLAYEYRKSINYLHLIQGREDQVPPENVHLGRWVPSPEDRRKLGIREVSITAPGNSLVIANTVGFHKRGVLAPGRVRRLIHVDFRRMMSPLNQIPFIQSLPAVEKKILENRREEKILVRT